MIPQKYRLIVLIPAFVSACFTNIYAQTPSPINPTDIKGTWYLNKWTLYHTLIIGDHSIEADNHIDTLFRFNYEISNDTLISWGGEPRQMYKNKIISVTKETLVLDGIQSVVGIRTYSRVNKHWKN